VVLQSVHNHSDARPGDRDYLTFIRNYIVWQNLRSPVLFWIQNKSGNLVKLANVW
jgi:hypothetical protein